MVSSLAVRQGTGLHIIVLVSVCNMQYAIHALVDKKPTKIGTQQLIDIGTLVLATELASNCLPYKHMPVEPSIQVLQPHANNIVHEKKE